MLWQKKTEKKEKKETTSLENKNKKAEDRRQKTEDRRKLLTKYKGIEKKKNLTTGNHYTILHFPCTI